MGKRKRRIADLSAELTDVALVADRRGRADTALFFVDKKGTDRTDGPE